MKSLLGKPDREIGGKEFLKSYGRVVSLGRLHPGLWRSQAWAYWDTPAKGEDTFIMFERGRVSTVQVRADPHDQQ